jgi:hypothetical protein
MLRDDVEDGALALIFALGVLLFHDARPRGGRRDEDAGERRQKALDRIREEIAWRKREGQKDRWGLFGKPESFPSGAHSPVGTKGRGRVV